MSQPRFLGQGKREFIPGLCRSPGPLPEFLRNKTRNALFRKNFSTSLYTERRLIGGGQSAAAQYTYGSFPRFKHRLMV
ncbi:MAG TPA: hypothetical protein VGD98_22765 [Ktedonobacteraceae bacterium]